MTGKYYQLAYLSLILEFNGVSVYCAVPSDRAVYGVGLQPLACWDCGFESSRRQGCLSVVS